MSTTGVLLVHGAWHGPDCWEAVVFELSRLGIPAVAPDLASSGFEATDLGGFHDDVTLVSQSLDRFGGSMILVGHSYGAMVASVAAAGQPAAVGLVFVAGLVAAEDESATTLILQGRTAEFADAVSVRDDGTTSISAARGLELLYQDCPEEIAERAAQRLRLQSTASVRSFAGKAGWREVPSHYIVCQRDLAIDPGFQEHLAASRATSVSHLPSGHSPMLSRPQAVAEILSGVIESTGQPDRG